MSSSLTSVLFFYPLFNPIKRLHLYTKYQYIQTQITLIHCCHMLNHGACSSKEILKVQFDSRSTKTLIHQSALPKYFKFILNLPLLRLQTLGRKKTSNKPIEITNLTFPEFYSIFSFGRQIAYSFDKNCPYDIIFGAKIIDGFTINYNKNIQHLIDHEILSRTQMSSLTKTCFDFNDDLCQNKQENTFDKEILNSYDS